MHEPTQAGTHAPVVLAGATGDLGGRIARALRQRRAPVVALVRATASGAALEALEAQGVELRQVDYADKAELARACVGASCVVSALAGLDDVIITAQSQLLEAAVTACVPRFIPSDYSLDFARLSPGSNRNLDLRRDFAERLVATPLQCTQVLCGAFAELLAGPAPLLFPRLRRVLYWGDADVPMDFTAMDDVAGYTAAAALDADAPRTLRVRGSTLSARQLAQAASAAWGKPFTVTRMGSLATLARIIAVARYVAPQPKELYPPWQGMQYLHNMFSGVATLTPLNGDRYPEVTPMSVATMLATQAKQG